MSGKGSKQRPLSVSKKQFDENFDRIFSKKDEEMFQGGFDLIDDVCDAKIEYVKITDEPIIGLEDR